MKFNRFRGTGRPAQRPPPGVYILDSSLVPRIEEYAASKDINDLDALSEFLRASNREYQRQKLGPFRKMVAKAVTVVRRRASEAEQQERTLRKLERKHVSRTSTPGTDDLSDDGSEEARSSEEESDSEEEELAFEGMEEERHGHNLLNSSLRGFYDTPKHGEGVVQDEGEGVNRSSPPAGPSGRGVNGLGPGSVNKAGGKRKREERDSFDSGGRDGDMVGDPEKGLGTGVETGFVNQESLSAAVDPPQEVFTPEQALVAPASANGHKSAGTNSKAPPGTREHVPKGPDGTRLRRGKKFAKGLARRSSQRGDGYPLDPGGGPMERDGESASLGASQPKNVWFKDLGGIEGTLDAIRELILYPLAHPEVYDHLRVQPPRGVLLHGPPGCGKTMLAHAIANETGVRFLSISAPEVVSGMSGESEAKIRTLFQDAEKLAPALIFIDEIDAITPKRETAQREMERRIVAQLLTCMDALNEPHSSSDVPEPSVSGHPSSEPSNPAQLTLENRPRKGHVIVIGATNRPDSLDPALRRAGRFDREIGLGIPDEEARVRIMKVIAGRLRLEGDFDFERIAKKTPGFVGADLQALTTEAAAVAVKRIFTGLEQGKSEGGNGTSRQGDMIGAVAERSNPDALTGRGVNERLGDEGTTEAAKPGPNGRLEAEVLEVAGEKLSTDKQTALPPIPMAGAQPQPNPFPSINTLVGNTPSEARPASKEPPPPSPLPPTGLGTSPSQTEISLPLHERPNWRCPFTPKQLATLSITMPDFEAAIPKVQPSSKREGFATIPDVTWADVGSLDEIKEELEYAVSVPIRCPEQFQAMGLPLATGVLLYGPPGCGKTLVAKAIANDAGANFISIKGPELLNKYVGESERAVRQIFTRARDSFPCILFFDEMDALAPKRGGSDGNAAAERVVNQLLTEMDGLEQRKGVYLIAATNRPDMIDPALLRPGRLDKLLYVPLPTPEGRAQILRTLTRKTPLAPGLDVAPIGESDACRGFSGADLAALVREACIAAIKEATSRLLSISQGAATPPDPGPPLVHAKHFDLALGKVSASVSAVDERRYEILRAKLRSSRGHLKPEANREKLPREAGDTNEMVT